MVGELCAAVEKARRDRELVFAAVLPEENITAAFTAARASWNGWLYSPAITVWVFLSQCLSADHSCRDAVGRLVAWLAARGRRPCSPKTGAYCTARDKLPRAVCRHLLRETGRRPEQDVPAEWLWHGRRVRVGDGTTLTMPDTAANQAAYPQPRSQQPGCGFPIVRMVVLFSLAVGTVLEVAWASYTGKRTGENSLLRGLRAPWNPATCCCWTAISAGGSIWRCGRPRRRSGGAQPPVADHRLPHRPPPGPRRSSGRMGQAATARLDDADGVRRLARGADATRGPHPSRATGLPHANDRGRDQLARRDRVHRRGDRPTVPPPVGRGIAPAQSQDRAPDGPPPLPDTAPGGQ